ncbi:MAG: heavy-metal-associated domain-containing protein [Bdellovibrionales bacterium]
MTTYVLTGMTCEKCVAKVTAAVTRYFPDAHVTLNPPRLTVPDDANLATINTHLHAVGDYQAVPLASANENEKTKSWLQTYQPLLLIVAYIFGVSYLAAPDTQTAARYFMAGFFLVFSFFKFLDLRGFADAYSSYDLLASRWRPYGYIYAFVELALGVAYLVDYQPVLVNTVTLVVMLFSGLGVLNALRQKRTIRCACLGTVLNLPMSTITLVEDFGMALMAAMALL